MGVSLGSGQVYLLCPVVLSEVMHRTCGPPLFYQPLLNSHCLSPSPGICSPLSAVPGSHTTADSPLSSRQHSRLTRAISRASASHRHLTSHFSLDDSILPRDMEAWINSAHAAASGYGGNGSGRGSNGYSFSSGRSAGTVASSPDGKPMKRMLDRGKLSLRQAARDPLSEEMLQAEVRAARESKEREEREKREAEEVQQGSLGKRGRRRRSKRVSWMNDDGALVTLEPAVKAELEAISAEMSFCERMADEAIGGVEQREGVEGERDTGEGCGGCGVADTTEGVNDVPRSAGHADHPHRAEESSTGALFGGEEGGAWVGARWVCSPRGNASTLHSLAPGSPPTDDRAVGMAAARRQMPSSRSLNTAGIHSERVGAADTGGDSEGRGSWEMEIQWRRRYFGDLHGSVDGGSGSCSSEDSEPEASRSEGTRGGARRRMDDPYVLMRRLLHQGRGGAGSVGSSPSHGPGAWIPRPLQDRRTSMSRFSQEASYCAALDGGPGVDERGWARHGAAEQAGGAPLEHEQPELPQSHRGAPAGRRGRVSRSLSADDEEEVELAAASAAGGTDQRATGCRPSQQGPPGRREGPPGDRHNRRIRLSRSLSDDESIDDG